LKPGYKFGTRPKAENPPELIAEAPNRKSHSIPNIPNSYSDAQRGASPYSEPVLFPLMGIEIGMGIIYFHSEK